jgi:replicative DNA helicase
MIEIDELFRSIIYIKTAEGIETISQRDCVKNFRAMQDIIPKSPEEKAYKNLYYYILEYIKSCDTAELSVPSFEFIKNHFQTVEGSESTLVILDKIKSQQPYVGMDYRTILKQYNEQQQILELDKILNNAQKIASTGFDIVKGKVKTKLKGISDSISYIARETRAFSQQKAGIKTESQIVSEEDAREVKEQYNKSEANPTDSIGIQTWLREIDESTGGLKSGELMIITAFTGHCKTTFALNQAYRALYGGWNTAFVTLEMSFQEIRNKIYILHSCNPKFRIEWPKYAHLVGKISYNDVLYGRLNKEEKEYFFKVCDDLDNTSENSPYGRFFVWQPDKTVTTLSEIDLKFRQYQQDLQLTGRNLDFGVIDYISLMGADEGERSRDHNETTNNIVKNLKRFCLTFNNGMGIRMLSPHQCNRDGYREAKKNEGLYDLTALSNNHEVERSADLAISSYKFDTDGNNNRLKYCCLKNRRNSFFKPFDACIDFETGFIWNYTHAIENADNITDVSEVLR